MRLFRSSTPVAFSVPRRSSPSTRALRQTDRQRNARPKPRSLQRVHRLVEDGVRHTTHARQPKKAGRDRDRRYTDGPHANIGDSVEGGWRIRVLGARLQPARRNHEAVHLRHLPCSLPLRPLPRTVGRATCTAAWSHVPLARSGRAHPALQKATRLLRAALRRAHVACMPERGCGGAPVSPQSRRFHCVRLSRRRCCTAVRTWSWHGS